MHEEMAEIDHEEITEKLLKKIYSVDEESRISLRKIKLL